MKKKNCKEIIARIDKDFQSSQKKKLVQQIGEIDQDFINRGLYCTDRRVGQFIRAHIEYISNLINNLLESIERNYPRLSPIKCKPHLLIIVEREYEKLLNKVPGWLLQSGFTSTAMRDSFEQNINNMLMETQQDVENKCALWEERWKNKKKERRIEFIKWFIGPGIVLTIIVLLLRGYLLHEQQSTETNKPAQKNLKILDVDPNTGKTAINVRTRERVVELREFIIKEKIDPWLFMWHESFKVTKADGNIIGYTGLEYSGSIRTIFLSKDYIDPFLKEGIRKVFDETGRECRVNNIKAEASLREASALLAGIIGNVYNRMAEVDGKLRQKSAGSEEMSIVNVKDRIDFMVKYMREQLYAALELYSD